MPNPLDCSAVSDACPVSASIYGYYPSLYANASFCAIFGILLAANLVLGVYYRTWTYTIALTLGCLAEALGYIGRVILHYNPFDSVGFEIQICCLILAPAFVSAAIYLTLKHLTLCFGPEHSRLPPHYYTSIFISADLLALIFQGSGGGIAATAKSNNSLRDVGDALMMTGIVFQVFTLLVFGSMAVDYVLRLYQSGTARSFEASSISKKLSFKFFVPGLIIAYLAVFIRCVYRIAEMSGGWRNPIMQNETEFIVLDSVMVTIATLILTIFHPGYCFPRLSGTLRSSSNMDEKPISEEAMAGPLNLMSKAQ